MSVVTGYIVTDAESGGSPIVDGDFRPSGFLPDLDAVDVYMDSIGVDENTPAKQPLTIKDVSAKEISRYQRIKEAVHNIFRQNDELMALAKSLKITSYIIFGLIAVVAFFNPTTAGYMLIGAASAIGVALLATTIGIAPKVRKNKFYTEKYRMIGH